MAVVAHYQINRIADINCFRVGEPRAYRITDSYLYRIPDIGYPISLGGEKYELSLHGKTLPDQGRNPRQDLRFAVCSGQDGGIPPPTQPLHPAPKDKKGDMISPPRESEASLRHRVK